MNAHQDPKRGVSRGLGKGCSIPARTPQETRLASPPAPTRTVARGLFHFATGTRDFQDWGRCEDSRRTISVLQYSRGINSKQEQTNSDIHNAMAGEQRGERLQLLHTRTETRRIDDTVAVAVAVAFTTPSAFQYSTCRRHQVCQLHAFGSSRMQALPIFRATASTSSPMPLSQCWSPGQANHPSLGATPSFFLLSGDAVDVAPLVDTCATYLGFEGRACKS